jgi:hypothetical protein
MTDSLCTKTAVHSLDKESGSGWNGRQIHQRECHCAYQGLEAILNIHEQRIKCVPVEQRLHAISTPPRRVVPQRLDVAELELVDTGLRTKTGYVRLRTYLYDRALEMCQRERLRAFPTAANHIDK